MSLKLLKPLKIFLAFFFILNILFLCLTIILRTLPNEEIQKIEQIPFNEITLQVLNGCGKKRLAREVRNVLIDKGFDVLSFDNAEKFLYEKTVIIIRNMNYDKFNMLYKEVPVQKVYMQINEHSLYDFIIIIGKDYKRIFAL